MDSTFNTLFQENNTRATDIHPGGHLIAVVQVVEPLMPAVRHTGRNYYLASLCSDT